MELKEPFRATGEGAELDVPPLSIRDRQTASSSSDSAARASWSMGSSSDPELLPELVMVARDGGDMTGADRVR